MICPKCGNDMENSMYCSKCNAYPFEDKKTCYWKKTLKTMGITMGIVLACITVIVVIVLGISGISQRKAYREQINTHYEEICEKYSDKDYYSALSCIKNFKDNYSDDNKMMAKVSDLFNNIESELYNNIKEADIAISECNTYLEFYPNGKYTKEVNELITVFTEKQAIQDIGKAKTAIQQNGILEADSILQSIIKNDMVSEDVKKQAKDLLNSISTRVSTEKGKKAILGKWTKETGVQYTFEEDGHMSVSMSSNYDSSMGTTADGREVISILSEIEDFSRIVRGGTWKYVGTQKTDSETLYVYNLFYYSSQYVCFIPVNNSWKMGITLSSGFGDMSILTK